MWRLPPAQRALDCAGRDAALDFTGAETVAGEGTRALRAKRRRRLGFADAVQKVAQSKGWL
jgi:hypothetical protein